MDEALLERLEEAFRAEAEERLASLSSGLLDLEKAPDPARQDSILEVVFREAHSLKGAARAVNFTDIEILFQSMEGVFAAIRKGEAPLSAGLFDMLHASVKSVEGYLAAPDKDQQRFYAQEIAALAGKLENLKSQKAGDAPGPGTGRGHAGEDVPEKAEKDFGGYRGIKKAGQVESEAGGAEDALPGMRRGGDRPMTPGTVRIPISKLDAVLLEVEEFVSLKLAAGQHVGSLRGAVGLFERWRKRWGGIDQDLRLLRKRVEKEDSLAGLLEFLDWSQEYINGLEQKIKRLTKNAEQNRRTLSRMVDDLIDEVKRITMFPFSSLLDTFPRMVRDISREQGKDVDLIFDGGEIEIDRRILEEMKTPLIHLLRNAIDHGLEKPEKRVARKKPARGTITLSISQTEGKKIEILLSDDGEGIDLAGIRKKAVELGIISVKDAERLTDRETLSLMFRSQVSTSPLVTGISGRGLGLAIVQETVERLGGRLTVETEPGRGTSFRMRLPVTLATFRGVLVKAAGNLFILPSRHVERTLRIPAGDVRSVENRATIQLDGEALSLLVLADALGIPHGPDRDGENPFITVAVLGIGERRIAFVVDAVLGEREVLVKGLGKQIRRLRNIAGATILGTGEVVPILDVPDLLGSPLETTAGLFKIKAGEGSGKRRRKSILVAEDSITSRTLLKNILESAGYDVKTAVDGQEAFTSFKSGSFDLVVSDVEMPRMDGFELTERIRSHRKFAKTPVVLVTGRESREDRERGIDVGANAYIVKSSIDQGNLLEVIKSMI